MSAGRLALAAALAGRRLLSTSAAAPTRAGQLVRLARPQWGLPPPPPSLLPQTRSWGWRFLTSAAGSGGSDDDGHESDGGESGGKGTGGGGSGGSGGGGRRKPVKRSKKKAEEEPEDSDAEEHVPSKPGRRGGVTLRVGHAADDDDKDKAAKSGSGGGESELEDAADSDNTEVVLAEVRWLGEQGVFD